MKMRKNGNVVAKSRNIVVKRVVKRMMERTQKTETELDILVEFVLCCCFLEFP